MNDRSRLWLGIGVSLVFHGVLFATVPTWGNADEEGTGEGTEPPRIEVVSLSPEAVREILEPRVRPAAARPLEAPSEHVPLEARSWPALEVPRPTTPVEVQARILLPAPREVESVTHPPIVDVLRSVSPVPAVDVTPPPAPPTPTPEPAAGPPALAGLRGIVQYREPLVYPPSAERRGLEGVASIAVEVGDDGSVVSTRVLRSSGHRVLDRAAQRNLQRWRFDSAAVRAAGRGHVFRQDVQFQVK